MIRPQILKYNSDRTFSPVKAKDLRKNDKVKLYYFNLGKYWEYELIDDPYLNEDNQWVLPGEILEDIQFGE